MRLPNEDMLCMGAGVPLCAVCAGVLPGHQAESVRWPP